MKDRIKITSERVSQGEYIDFLKRTDLGSQYPKERFDERIEKLIEEKDGRSHFLEVMRSKPLKIKYTDLIGTAFTPPNSLNKIAFPSITGIAA